MHEKQGTLRTRALRVFPLAQYESHLSTRLQSSGWLFYEQSKSLKQAENLCFHVKVRYEEKWEFACSTNLPVGACYVVIQQSHKYPASDYGLSG